nr:unnamed protein product [Digitaria exilis]
MADPPALKRPKLEKDDDHDLAHWPRPSANGAAHAPPVASASAAANGAPPDDEDEEPMAEEAVVALIAHRERDVERCKLKLLHYQSLLDTAEMKLAEAQSRLVRYRDREPTPRQTEPKPSQPPPWQGPI